MGERVKRGHHHGWNLALDYGRWRMHFLSFEEARNQWLDWTDCDLRQVGASCICSARGARKMFEICCRTTRSFFLVEQRAKK